MNLENKLKKVLIAGSLVGAGLNLTSCITYESCPAYESHGYANKINIEIKKQDYTRYNNKREYKFPINGYKNPNERRL